MITFDNVSFRYKRRKPLFENLSLNLVPGHIYGLLGRNGEGKSTLLRHIAGLVFPDKGEIDVFGFKPFERRPGFLREVFYIPEEPYLPSGTVKSLSERYGSLYVNFDHGVFVKAIFQFDIFENEKLDNLSYGQRKKVIIAFALAANTKVLLMDEPTNGLDIPSKTQFKKLVLSTFNEERIIVMATHQVRDLENLIDTIIILHENKLALQAKTDEVSQLLSFQIRPELQDHEDVLYAQISPGGYKVVTKNIFGNAGQINLEYLFNAVIESPSSMKEIFDQLPVRN
ncbi:ABC transporter ATP-binding protein [Dyadobacter luticola]|uniref:ABC transporter ATP-binding protein n=1 Tax=Dyadobacter luticola TaxID=1979387 RepID=A0A5R9KZB1_9BACT|nr:ABC transporter ATP-binding protein [Dyadobacter luticola]TLV01430.1 ABC transporter ATP-binding protein [Dyadobacter luticola]